MPKKALPTFEVDKEGLRKLLAKRGPGFAVWELTQNAWDEDVTQVDITLEWRGNHHAWLTVTDDDPDGFTDLRHAYTLFAESEKKADPTKRGRFNLGEKLVIAICDEAEVATTTGTIRFGKNGRTHSAAKTARGSIFSGLIRMTKSEYDETIDAVKRLIPPEDVRTTFNGEPLHIRKPAKIFETILPTEIADDEGRMKRSFRKARVSLYEPMNGEKAAIYEMGIPVVATGDRWHVNVNQKVPLNVDRDNVTPSYLQDVRRVVLDYAHDLLDEETAQQSWVTNAVEDKAISAEAVEAFMKKRFGDKVVMTDLSDPEANKLAASEGYTVLSSRTLPKAVNAHLRNFQIVKPAGQVTPSPKPYVDGQGTTRKTLPPEKWTPEIRRHVEFAQAFAKRLMDVDLLVEIVNDPECMNFQATYRSGSHQGALEYNLRTLGRRYFRKNPVRNEHIDILIHEFGHHYCSDHLDRRYLNALTSLGAGATMVALKAPAFYEAHSWEPVTA